MTILYHAVQVFFIIVDILLFVGFVYAYAHARGFRPHFDFSHTAGHGEAKQHASLLMKLTEQRWHGIAEKRAMATPENLRLAVIEADAIVDSALKSMGLEGEHMADRLGNMETEDLRSIERLWQAHRLRNDLVHTPGFVPGMNDVERALEGYESFLKEIGALPQDASETVL